MRKAIYLTSATLAFAFAAHAAPQQGTLVLIQADESGDWAQLEHANYTIDGNVVYDARPRFAEGSKRVEIMRIPLDAGDHLIEAKINIVGVGNGPFTYLDGYRFKFKKSYPMRIHAGVTHELEIAGVLDGPVTKEFPERRLIRFRHGPFDAAGNQIAQQPEPAPRKVDLAARQAEIAEDARTLEATETTDAIAATAPERVEEATPEPVAAEPVAVAAVVDDPRPEPIFFGFDRDDITSRWDAIIAEVAAFIGRHPEVDRVEIAGHTDPIGPEIYNLDLGQRRADAASRQLVRDHDIRRTMLRAKSYGETRLVTKANGKEARARNRRVEFTFYAGDEVVFAARASQLDDAVSALD